MPNLKTKEKLNEKIKIAAPLVSLIVSFEQAKMHIMLTICT